MGDLWRRWKASRQAPYGTSLIPQQINQASSSDSSLEIAYPWMDWLKKNMGQTESTGEKATSFDEMLFTHTNYGKLENDIMVPGCAATISTALELTGYKSAHSAVAADYLKYGLSCDLKYGAIIVFKWESGDHHVSTFVKDNDDGTAVFLGGNQDHLIKLSTYSKKYIEAIRWPVK